MANRSDDVTGLRHVRCPRCHSVLQEPSGVPVYQCGGCGTSLRARARTPTKSTKPAAGSPSSGLQRQADVPTTTTSASPSRSSRRLASGDVASSSTTTTPDDATRRTHQQPNRRDTADSLLVGASATKGAAGSGDGASTSSGTSTPHVTTTTTADTRSPLLDLVSASSKRVSQQPATTAENKQHHQSTSSRHRPGGAYDEHSGFRRQRDTRDANRNATSSESQQVDSHLPDAARKKGVASVQQPQFRRDRREVLLAPKPAEPAAGSKPSPPRHEVQAAGEDLAPLRHKILKAVNELKGDLSELFSKSPDLSGRPTTRARPPRVPKQQQGYAAAASTTTTLPAIRTAPPAHASAVHHGSAARRPVKQPGHRVSAATTAPRGLPSRRYRRCRADPCRENVLQVGTCHYRGRCCRVHHGSNPLPECGSCRGHCCGRACQQPSAPSAANKDEAKRRPPAPRHHCLPVLNGAPFIICSSCFSLVQMPADFTVSMKRQLPKLLQCGSCSAVLSYNYRDVPANKGYAEAEPDPFVDGFELSSYSTEDEQHASRNTSSSFDTVEDGGVKKKGAVDNSRLHRLMGYASASELLLYKSFDERTTPEYDRKGKGVVCIDGDEDDDDDSDDDQDSSGVLKRGGVWPLPGKGFPAGPGGIRIKS